MQTKSKSQHRTLALTDQRPIPTTTLTQGLADGKLWAVGGNKKKMRSISFIIALCLITDLACSQRIGMAYYGISSDSLQARHLLEFKNDSVVEVSTFPRHMSQAWKMAFSYSKDNGTVRIFHNDFKDSDSIVLINKGFSQFTNRVELKPDGKPLLDEKNKVIYVLYKDFRPNYDLIYLVEGETYKVETSLPNSYGLLEKGGKPNKRLAKKINTIKQDWGSYTIKIYQGIEAYRKFGYDTVLGVIEINKRK